MAGTNDTLLSSTLSEYVASDNGTISSDPSRRAILTSIDVLSLLITYGSTLAMGCDVGWDQFKEAFRRPQYLAVGLAGQYLLMPLMGLGSISAFNLEGYVATGVMVLSCSPGGGYSNLITYLLNGEVWLSVVLTTLSNTVAFGAMPLSIWLYRACGVTTGRLVVPFWNMLVTLLLLDAALALGLLCRWKWPSGARLITKFGSASMCLCHLIWLCLWLCLWLWLDPGVLRGSEGVGDPLSAALLVSGAGLAVPWAVSKLCGFSNGVSLTLAVETSYQSIGTAFTVCMVSFTREEAHESQTYIFLYSVLTTTLGTLTGGLFQALSLTRRRKDVPSASEIIYTRVTRV